MRGPDLFAIEGTGQIDPKISLTALTFKFRRVEVIESVYAGHMFGLKKKNAKYSYTRSEVTTFTIPALAHSFYQQNLFTTSILPKFVVVGLVKSAAFDGADLRQGPFVFENNDIASVILRRDGQSLPFRTGYLGPLTAEHHYMSMVQNTGMVNTNLSTGVTIDAFRNGPCALFSFNLAPDYDPNPTPHPINVVAYGTFDTLIEITKNREFIRSHV